MTLSTWLLIQLERVFIVNNCLLQDTYGPVVLSNQLQGADCRVEACHACSELIQSGGTGTTAGRAVWPSASSQGGLYHATQISPRPCAAAKSALAAAGGPRIPAPNSFPRRWAAKCAHVARVPNKTEGGAPRAHPGPSGGWVNGQQDSGFVLWNALCCVPLVRLSCRKLKAPYALVCTSWDPHRQNKQQVVAHMCRHGRVYSTSGSIYSHRECNGSALHDI